jgi:protein-disulfide isomerase
MSGGKVVLAGVFVAAVAAGIVPLFLHDQNAAAAKVSSFLKSQNSSTHSPQENQAGMKPVSQDDTQNTIGKFGSKQLLKSELASDEKMKLFEAQNTYYNSMEDILTQRYITSYFEKLKEEKNYPDIGSAQKAFFDERSKVAESEVSKFLEENKSNPSLQKIPEDQRAGQIRSYLEGRNRQVAVKEIVDQAKSSGAIQVAMAKPVEPKIDVTDGGNAFLGSQNAKVTIVEFADYQCPFCARVVPVLKNLLKKYDGKIRWVYRDFPLKEIHPEAAPAAIAAECAGEQNKYFEMHGLLFDNYQSLNSALYTDLAKKMNLNLPKFEECLKDPKIAAEVDADMADGQRFGVQGTPSYFVNGRKAPGDEKELTRLIEDELAKAN